MSVVTPLRRNRSAASWILSACESASGLGVYLLPVFYVAFFATLFLLWREPHSAVWLIAACGALGWAMTAWAIVFRLASMRPVPAAVHDPGETVHPAQSRMRPVPLRFAQMPMRSCHRTCSIPSGSETGFSVVCFHARCTEVNSSHAHDIGGVRKETAR